MSIHAKTDSEVTSLTASSPTRSPRRPVYYVQSPSRDSHDGEKTTNSFHSTPVLSPSASPGHHSRDSSSTRFSGSLKPGSRKNGHQPIRKGRNEFGAIEEEGLIDEEYQNRGFPRRCCYLLTFVIGFSVLFTLFSLILWGAARPQKPRITVNTITFNDFMIQAGNDGSGVATDMLSMNSTVKFVFRNTGTFFGVHVDSTPIVLSYSDLTIASGNVKKFYQSRKSQRTLTVTLRGSYKPLYGASSGLSSKDGQLITPATLNLSFMVRARAYVLGELVKPKFYKRVHCSVILDPKKMNVAISMKKACTYE